MEARVEYDLRPIRHVAVQCTQCNHWFAAYEITDKTIRDVVDLQLAEFNCPVCGNEFGYHSRARSHEILEIQECDSVTEVYDGCLHKYENWK